MSGLFHIFFFSNVAASKCLLVKAEATTAEDERGVTGEAETEEVATEVPEVEETDTAGDPGPGAGTVAPGGGGLRPTDQDPEADLDLDRQ